MDTGRPIRGVVADASDGLWIKLECGGSVHWPHTQGLKLFANVLVYWDYTKNRARRVTKTGDEEEDNGEPFEKEEQEVPDIETLGPEHDPALDVIDIIHSTDRYNNNDE